VSFVSMSVSAIWNPMWILLNTAPNLKMFKILRNPDPVWHLNALPPGTGGSHRKAFIWKTKRWKPFHIVSMYLPARPWTYLNIWYTLRSSKMATGNIIAGVHGGEKRVLFGSWEGNVSTLQTYTSCDLTCHLPYHLWCNRLIHQSQPE
jgi:hypothetical protein